MWSYLGGVRAYCDRVFSPIFADFRHVLQIFEKNGKKWQVFRVDFPGSLGDFSHFDPKS